MKATIEIDLQDQAGGLGKIATTVEVTAQGILVGFKGYGENIAEDATARPVLIEVFNGHPRVSVWQDINDEDPTDISLEDAQVENREKE